MKAIIVTFIFFISISALHAQSVSRDSILKAMDISGDYQGATVHLPVVKKHPGFPGGTIAWHNFLRTNFDTRVPFAHKAIPGTYKVMIRFIVDSDGTPKDIGAESNSSYGMESEVIRCIRISGKWLPAETSSGRKVAFTVRVVVSFTVTRNDVVLVFQ